ncbi:MAG: hypothetical protein WCI03_03710 [bacterium]
MKKDTKKSPAKSTPRGDGITIIEVSLADKRILQRELKRLRNVKRGKWKQSDTAYQKVCDCHEANPGTTNKEIHRLTGVSIRTVHRIRGRMHPGEYTITTTTTPP